MKRKRHLSDEIEEYSQNRKYLKINDRDCSTNDVRRNLPVYRCKRELLAAISAHQVVIVTGDTGCGKSTQIPQYLLESSDLCGRDGGIACTQPRRVGAISLATRVSQEMNCRLGDVVGYAIRFESVSSGATRIRYTTDGVLLRELQSDPLLRAYSVVMIDEAHERTIETDALLAVLKRLLRDRRDLKLIVCSATLHTDKFSEYFSGAPVFRIAGRAHPVAVEFAKRAEADYIGQVVDKVRKIHRKTRAGDVLVFLPGQEEIEACCQQIRRRLRPGPADLEPWVLPAYSALAKRELAKIFLPTPKRRRKIVVATNIAETSLTIEGISFVVDPGLVKLKVYCHSLGIDQLVTTDVSRAQAAQRAGRAGRVASGTCYRLYSERKFARMDEHSVPEIQRANLANTVLLWKSVGVRDVESFDLIDHPGRDRLRDAVAELVDLGALSESGGDLTALGSLMAAFPLDPTLSKILIMSSHKRCSEEVVTIVAMLCVQNVFDKPARSIHEANQKKLQLNRAQGDHLTLLYTYGLWREHGYSRRWCDDHFVRYSSLQQARSIRDQLVDIMRRARLALVSCGAQVVEVQNTLSLYYFRRNAARKELGLGYRTLADNQLVHIHPSSALFDRQPGWVVFHDIVITRGDKYIREVTKINPVFLQQLIPPDFQ